MTAEQAAVFRPLIDAALAEDIGSGDITTTATVDENQIADADLVFRSGGVVAGLEVVASIFHALDAGVDVKPAVVDGERVSAGAVVATVHGSARAILSGERTALNLLARLSGIATLTRAYVDAVADPAVRITDTRKTTPGLRALERYAVRAGGGYNHRFGLADAVLIKDNHLAASGGIAEAVIAARRGAPESTIIEVECDSLEQVRQALESGADAVLLDNMSVPDVRKAVALAADSSVVEASGGITLANVKEVASTGVDIISVGALTHGASSLDVGLDFSARPAPAVVKETASTHA
ncbi:MAG: carboxylating nicotinate-nucleotide diphosphorylase [Candidatus Eremiobacter antarcticus]|nr:carboxylating nicotinate-nucleotide diphosphorylase [Candidatus Eremiobacteraeota bacterium]MBC5807483.1 carboxylating nicotinate-nucleotide diphosphorylase [Candidatus Eremiobacteraeota bacterium]PZR61500.1 MAG: carboxylating nicotinate-nucleotide diphosphorylase [Candidatus Eremiobacter sp. RRmetagenome_bin22]